MSRLQQDPIFYCSLTEIRTGEVIKMFLNNYLECPLVIGSLVNRLGVRHEYETVVRQSYLYYGIPIP